MNILPTNLDMMSDYISPKLYASSKNYSSTAHSQSGHLSYSSVQKGFCCSCNSLYINTVLKKDPDGS